MFVQIERAISLTILQNPSALAFRKYLRDHCDMTFGTLKANMPITIESVLLSTIWNGSRECTGGWMLTSTGSWHPRSQLELKVKAFSSTKQRSQTFFAALKILSTKNVHLCRTAGPRKSRNFEMLPAKKWTTFRRKQSKTRIWPWIVCQKLQECLMISGGDVDASVPRNNGVRWNECVGIDHFLQYDLYMKQSRWRWSL